MVNCIICHMEIRVGVESFDECPNGHPAHDECLKEWIIHSSNCPLCSEPYSETLMKKFKKYLDRKELEKQNELEAALHREKVEKMEKVAQDIVFMKFQESIEKLMVVEEYDYALSRLDAMDDDTLTESKKRNILFLRGKINYLRGRYDLAISSLFKLVKEKYDYPDAFLYLGRSYQELGLEDKAKWAFDRVQ